MTADKVERHPPAPDRHTRADRTVGTQVVEPADRPTIFGVLLAALPTDADDQIDLLIVPPDLSQEAANRVMAKAADPANRAHAPDLLDAAGPATRGGPTRIALADVAEAAWDNEGGARPAANLTDG